MSQEGNKIVIQINGQSPKQKTKKVLNIQKNIIAIEIIQNIKKFENNMVTNIINFGIKSQQIKKKTEILFKKVDNFINSNDKLQSKKINRKLNDNNNNTILKEGEQKKNKKEIKSKIKEEKKKNVKKDIFELKCDKLIFFKDVVSKIEIIYDRMSILRSKGYNLPIEIKIEIKYPNIAYELSISFN